LDIHIEEKPTSCLYDTPLLHQSSFWSQVKRKQGLQPLAFDIKVRASDVLAKSPASFLLDDILVLLSPIGRGRTLGYVPYGPLLSPVDSQMGPFLENLAEQLHERLPDDCALLRFDLPWQRPWEDGDLDQSLQELRLNWGTERRRLHKSGSDQLPPDTLVLDIGGNEEEILARMHKKTRYNIRLALRKGVTVRQGTAADLPIFYALYRETCRRNGVNLHDISYFSTFFGPEDKHAGFSLFFTELDGVPLSAMFLTKSANRATYLYGASSSTMRNSMSTYALQWNAILQARRWGCTQYDLFGIAPSDDRSHPMHGLNKFKRGFGGTEIHRMGCWDYPFDKDVAEEFFANDLVVKGYHRH
jgi:lipid II:glycine glycyltransferase (peptidoglycan interpeptide bridge formation enzyme)